MNQVSARLYMSVISWLMIIGNAISATAFGTGYLKINPIRMICYAAFAGLLLLH